ncbi:unnamed protein product [Prunus brigantina]
MVVRSTFYFSSKPQSSDLQSLHTKLCFRMKMTTQEKFVVLVTLLLGPILACLKASTMGSLNHLLKQILGRNDVTSWDRLRRSTILSSLGPPICHHGFVSGNSQATSQWVTHPGIALAQTHLTSEFP